MVGPTISAIATCDMALDTEVLARDDRGGTYINRGVMKLRRHLYEAAHLDFDAGIALIPKAGEAWVNPGRHVRWRTPLPV